MRSPSSTGTIVLPKLRASRSSSAYPYPLTPVYRVAEYQPDRRSTVTSGKLWMSKSLIGKPRPPSVILSAWIPDTVSNTPVCVTPSGQADCPCVWACTAAGKAKAVASVRATRAVARAAVRRSRGGGGCPCQAGHGLSPFCVATRRHTTTTGWIIMMRWCLHDQGTDGQIKIPHAGGASRAGACPGLPARPLPVVFSRPRWGDLKSLSQLLTPFPGLSTGPGVETEAPPGRWPSKGPAAGVRPAAVEKVNRPVSRPGGGRQVRRSRFSRAAPPGPESVHRACTLIEF